MQSTKRTLRRRQGGSKERFTSSNALTGADISQSNATTKGFPGSILPTAYTTISDLPFDRYLKCHIERDFTFLNKEDSAVIHPNAEAIFQGLELEVLEKTSGTKGKHSIKITAAIVVLEHKINRMQALINALSAHPDEIITQYFKEEGFNYEFTPDSLQQDIECIVAECKTLVLQLEQKRVEYNSLQGNSTGKPSYEDYDKILASISDIKSREINASDITTQRFCNYYNDLQRYNARTIKKVKNGG